jgi:sugar phosphate isomerase/epimerase
MTNEQLDYVTKKYREYCSRAASFGAKLGPENHWGATKSFVELKKIIDAVNESNFGILLHLGRWYEEDKDGSDRALAKKAMHIHVDYAHCAEAERVLPPFRDAGYSGCWSVECGKGSDGYNSVAYMLTQVKRAIAPLLY